MVIRGKSRGNASQLAKYLLAKGDNDNIRVFNINGTSQLNDLKKSLLEMSLTSELTKSNRGLYHAQINPAPGEDKSMSYEDWLMAAAILEGELKLVGQKRVIVLHEKSGRIHAHIVWERYDHEKRKMKSDSYSRLAQDRARQAMEIALQHKRTPYRNKHEPEIKKTLTGLWREAKSGSDFLKLALAEGYVIAKGSERRSFMVIDDTGRSFDLIRQLEGIKTKEVRERLQKEYLPKDKTVIAGIRSRQSLEQKQSKAITAIETFREKGEEHQRFKQVFNDAMEEAAEITLDKTDHALATAQKHAIEMKRFFKERTEQIKKQETLKTQFKEQFNHGDKKNKRNGLEL